MRLVDDYDIGSIYKSYYKDIYRYIFMLTQNKEAAEDIVQSTFLKTINGINHFRGDCSLKTWLISIARNEMMLYKKKEKSHVDLENIPEVYVSVTDNLIKIQCDKEAVGRILNYINELDEPKKSLMVLRLLDELTFVEIGQIINKSDTWCRVTFMRIKSNMLKELEGIL